MATKILVSDWESKIFAPGYYVALDEADKSLIVAVRGSSGLQDALTDLVCESYELDELPTVDDKFNIIDPDDVLNKEDTAVDVEDMY